LLAISANLSLAYVFLDATPLAYYTAAVSLTPQLPTLAFSVPPYDYTCVALARASRGAVTYTDFENLPSGWASRGGVTSIVSGGHKGNALQLSDNNGGVGGASQYYYNTRLDTTYSSLWVVVKVYGTPTNAYKGLALINSGLNRLYEVSIYSNYVYMRSYNVETIGGWRVLNSAAITGFNSNYWYTIVLNYVVTPTAVNFYVWVYDPNGNQVAYLTASSTSARRFTPAYVGLEVDGTYGTFDDFVISTADPRNVSFANLRSGLVFEIYDNVYPYPAYAFTAYSSTYSLPVVKDVVLGVGSGGEVLAYYPDYRLVCLRWVIPTSDAFLGGDSYSLGSYALSTSIDSTGTSANVSAYVSGSSSASTSFYAINLAAAQNYWVRLEVNLTASSWPPSGFNADIYVEGGTQRIMFRGGGPWQIATDWVSIPAGSAKRIIVESASMPAGSTATLVINLTGCVGGPNYLGACVIYPLRIQLSAP